ncbi:MAG: heat-inducible transcription repressor HrcA [Erysipelotrichales bacterium]|nr:heat-inducible transcription repressor HrcA [Erysipelotrichales bacterium]
MGERQEELLRIIVETYIQTFKPVGSKSLVDQLHVSSATIRNDMALLEDLNLLEKEHSSSGRVPSEAGYKYYVNNLMKPKEITGEDVLKLQTILNNNSLVVSDAIQKCMEIISDITHYTSVVIGPSVDASTLQQISIIPLDSDDEDETGDRRVVAVLVTNLGVVENKQVNISKEIDMRELIKTCELINKALVGTPLSKVTERLELEIKPRIKDVINRYEEVCNFFSTAFHDFAVDNSDVVFGGKTNILDYKEYNEPNKIKDMIAKLENVDLVKNIQTLDSDINVYIGEETEFDPDVTIIKTHYKVGNDEGTLAIIGPKRMEYDKVVTLLNFLKSYIEK